MSIFEILQNLADLMTSFFDIQTLITRIQRVTKVCFGCDSHHHKIIVPTVYNMTYFTKNHA